MTDAQLAELRERNERRKASRPSPGTVPLAVARTMRLQPDGTYYSPVPWPGEAADDVEVLLAEVYRLRSALAFYARKSLEGT